MPVTHRDLRRLSLACARSFGSFVEWLEPAQIDMEGEPESFVDLDLGRRLMVLRHASDACHLLTAHGLCSVYPARPSPCAAYPFAFATPTRPGGEQSTSETAEIAAEPRQLTLLSDAPCGSHLPNIDRSPPDPAWIEAVACVGAELNEYVKIVEIWNRQQRRRRWAGHRARTSEQYLDFLEQRSA